MMKASLSAPGPRCAVSAQRRFSGTFTSLWPSGVPLWPLWALAAWLLLLGTASATEEPVDGSSAAVQASKRHYDSGVAFFQAGDYASARIELEAGYQLSKIPVFLINLCIVAEKQNRLDEAEHFCAEYLASSPDAEGVADAQGRLDRIRQRVATEGARPVASIGGSPTPASGRVPKPAVALLAGGGALLLVGVATGIGALATAQQIDGKMISISYSDLQGIESQGNALNAASITFSVIGGAAVVAGAGWLGYWLAHRPRRTAAAQ